MEINNSFGPSQRLNPLDDYLFYKVMGQKGDEEQLLGFLNAVLGHSGKEQIKSVEILENKALTANAVGGKSCVLDVKAALADGTMVNIEVQLRNEHNMDRRSMFYWSRMYCEGIGRGQDYRELPKVIAINIVDFDFPSEGDFHTCFHLREDSNPSLILTNALEIHFINMVRWRKRAGKDIGKNPLHRWLTWFDAKSPPELVEEVAKMDSAIRAANEKHEYLTQDWQERDLYTRRLMAVLDYNSGMNHALEEGEQKGRQEGKRIGRQEGEERKAVEIARKALEEGASVEFVQKITGLDMETLQKLSG
jgi:predicted transposase/invertase (TIGR01784 family)